MAAGVGTGWRSQEVCRKSLNRWIAGSPELEGARESGGRILTEQASVSTHLANRRVANVSVGDHGGAREARAKTGDHL